MRAKIKEPMIFVGFEDSERKPFTATFREESGRKRIFWFDLLKVGKGVPMPTKKYILTINLEQNDLSMSWEEENFIARYCYEAEIVDFEGGLKL